MGCDLLILNGSVLTQDAKRPRAEAIAISGHKIVALGRSRDLVKLKGRKTKTIDAGGSTVLPGFIESHMHLFSGSAELSMFNADGIQGFSALADHLSAYASAHPGDGLLIGNQLSYVVLGASEVLTRQHLDRILPQRPVLLYAPDHHTAWANTVALQMAGILEGKKLTPGHEIVMGNDRFATGELREPEAIGPVADMAVDASRARLGLATGGEPEPYPDTSTFAADLDLLRHGIAHLARHGITSFHNMDGNFYTLELLAALESRGELTARARVPFHFKPFMAVAALQRAKAMAAAYKGPLLSSGTVKMFMDGVLDSGTAVMLDDYPDRAAWRGEPLFTQRQFNEVAAEADRLGLQVAVHAIGDGAVGMVLNGYAAARIANGQRDSRHRIEHIEVIARGDIKRLAQLGVIASMQPPHAPGVPGMPLQPTLEKIGRAKWRQAFAWNSIRQAGVPLALGTDWPVSDINPMRAIHAAVTRKPWEKGLPDQQLPLAAALEGYTKAGAYAEFAEASKGAVKVGYLADLVVMDCDLEKIPKDELKNAKPLFTITAGKVVFEL